MAIYDDYLTVILDSTPTRSKYIARRGYTRLARGVYVHNPSEWEGLEAWEQHTLLSCAVLDLNDNAVLAGGSAALVAGLPFEGSPDLVQLRSRGGSRTTALCSYTRASKEMMDAAIAVELEDSSLVRTTSYEDIVLDTAVWNGARVSLPIADYLLNRGLITEDSLKSALTHRGKCRGISEARLVQACATGMSESPRESLLRLELLENGLGDFYIQANVVDDNQRFIGRADFLFPQYGLGIEYDGDGKYEGQYGNDVRDSLRKDMKRHHKFTNAGIRLLRINNEMLTSGEWLDVVHAAIEKSLPRDVLCPEQYSGGLFVPMSVSWLVMRIRKNSPAVLAA